MDGRPPTILNSLLPLFTIHSFTVIRRLGCFHTQGPEVCRPQVLDQSISHSGRFEVSFVDCEPGSPLVVLLIFKAPDQHHGDS